jgi:hypothetical protein
MIKVLDFTQGFGQDQGLILGVDRLRIHTDLTDWDYLHPNDRKAWFRMFRPYSITGQGQRLTSSLRLAG